jgi:hypothetical protein
VLEVEEWYVCSSLCAQAAMLIAAMARASMVRYFIAPEYRGALDDRS